jgi:outer membrane protein assembly factor BamA
MRIPSDTAPSNLVLSNITIRPRDRHELAPELLISDENGAFNLGTGLGYTNRNFLGDARTFTARARFRTQTIGKFPDYFGRDADAIANLDLTFEVLQPYVFTNRFQGSWSLSFILDKQRRYLQNIFRNKFGVTGRFAEFTTGYLDWTLDAVGLVLNQNFRTDSSDRDLLQQLERLQKQQFNSILSFTIQRDKSNDLFSPSAGFIHSLTVEEAGMLGIALQRVFPRLRYTQFYRINLLGRWYTDLSENRFALLAFKLRAGLIEKYGESKSDPDRVIPQTHIFFAGGGGSVRGWQSRELIAGGVAQLGGAMIMEGSMEVRINPLQGLRDGFFDKIWLVQFLDAGNVWPRYLNFRFRDIAVATGFGFRYDTLFGPFRLDWGLRVYDPARPPGSRWIVERNFVRDTIRESVFHFGIGHAF